ncbi:hypothetical protein LTR50_006373 [Elasticomyces elasticus]|nr:hypothetical protein LTR50_006373 [Elasticomyces elasticus]
MAYRSPDDVDHFSDTTSYISHADQWARSDELHGRHYLSAHALPSIGNDYDHIPQRFPDIVAGQQPSVPFQTQATLKKEPQSRVQEVNPFDDSCANSLLQSSHGQYQLLQSGAPENCSGQNPTKHHGHASRLLKVWLWEILAAILAVLLLVVEIILLAWYDGRNVDKVWNHKWKINSIFALLTTLLEATLSFFVGACIGQLRWHWFKKSQRLEWLDVMTNARTPAGAARLIGTRGVHRQFAALGAFILLALLGVNTFIQNAVAQIPSFERIDLNASVPVSTNYTWYLQGYGAAAPMIAAIESGFYSGVDNQARDLIPVSGCDSGNCTFGTYQSLAVCSKCADISSAIKNPCAGRHCYDNDFYSIARHSNLTLAVNGGVINTTSDALYPSEDTLSGIGPLIARYQALIATDYSNPGSGALATECALYWCVQTYEGCSEDGFFAEVITSNWTNTSAAAHTFYNQPTGIQMTPPDCSRNNTTPSNSSYCTYWVSWASQYGLQTFLTGGTAGGGFLNGSASFKNTTANKWHFTTYQAAALTFYSTEATALNTNIWTNIDMVASYMTYAVRKSPLSLSQFYPELTFGYTDYPLQLFKVRWGWMAFPFALVLLSLAFLATTIVKSRHHQPWKSSVLPLMFHGFDDDDRRNFGQVDTLTDMENEMRGRQVRLGHDSKGKLRFTATLRSEVDKAADRASVHRLSRFNSE